MFLRAHRTELQMIVVFLVLGNTNYLTFPLPLVSGYEVK